MLVGRPGVGRAINFYMMGRGPTRSIKFLIGWAAARPGPVHHMVARPMRHGLYMGRPDNYVGRPDNYVGRPVDLTGRPMGRPMCCPVLKSACAYADAMFLRQLLVFR